MKRSIEITKRRNLQTLARIMIPKVRYSYGCKEEVIGERRACILAVKLNLIAAFEPVRELFQQSLSAARDKNAQLCIYVGEERVVDLSLSGPALAPMISLRIR